MSKDDAKVVGHNDDGSGETYGVWGEVDSPDGYGLATSDDVRIDGTLHGLDTFTVVVEDEGAPGNVVMGNSGNSADPEREAQTIAGGEDNETQHSHAVIAGGRENRVSGSRAFIGGGFKNRVDGEMATVGGGSQNEANTQNATVGGGLLNVASGGQSTIAGGYRNAASAKRATVPGGEWNDAAADFSFAAGRHAVVQGSHTGAFVWADDQGPDKNNAGPAFESAAENEFAARATGGARFVTALDGNDAPDTGVILPPGSGSWASLSSEAAKTSVSPVDPAEVLERVECLEVSTWEYDSDSDAVHMGPMAEEFNDQFGIGETDERISTVDADGVALAAIQGLAERLAERDEENRRLREQVDDIESRLERLEGEGEDADGPTPADD